MSKFNIMLYVMSNLTSIIKYVKFGKIKKKWYSIGE